MSKIIACLAILLVSLAVEARPHDSGPPATQERMVEWAIKSQKVYADPFNDVEVDVIFRRGDKTWRIPTFWCGGATWKVRFAPPSPGEYSYRLESTDPSNPDLNGREGHVRIVSYSGRNELLRRGPLRVSENKRYFEHSDGTPFYWLGDTWWTGLSDRISWEGFQKLTADRKAKGFTLVQLVAGLVPPEELPLTDPGFRNEGGSVWEDRFARINPNYFDYADRRILHLLDAGIVPAIVGGWRPILERMGGAKMKQHWRYIVARYGAYPVFWIVGGEVIDPPTNVASRIPGFGEFFGRPIVVPGWTEIAEYLRAVDAYRHPMTAHEFVPPFDVPLDQALTNFDLIQSGHGGWPSIAVSIAQINMRYARTSITKPVVQGEIGYENHQGLFYEDFQRAAFWLSMLNGAAGYTYGAEGVFEANSGDKPLHRLRYSFLSWEEGMALRGSYQVGLGAKLLRQYRWWHFEPHPEWIDSGGTTLLEPRAEITGSEWGGFKFDKDYLAEFGFSEANYPRGEWQAKKGTFRRPYAAGIPGEVRFFYMLQHQVPPTVLRLERGVRYHAYLFEPSMGIEFDLGTIERPAPGDQIFRDDFSDVASSAWVNQGSNKVVRTHGALSTSGDVLVTLQNSREANAVVAADARGDADAALVLRYQNLQNYVAAVYAPRTKSLHLLDRRNGDSGRPLGQVQVTSIGDRIRLSAEVRDGKGVASVTDGKSTYTTSIVDLTSVDSGSVGLLHEDGSTSQVFDNFELSRSPIITSGEPLQRKLYDAEGRFRGELVGSSGLDWDYLKGIFNVASWDSFAREKHILLDAYRIERLPTIGGDWVLILETKDSRRSLQ